MRTKLRVLSSVVATVAVLTVMAMAACSGKSSSVGGTGGGSASSGGSSATGGSSTGGTGVDGGAFTGGLSAGGSSGGMAGTAGTMDAGTPELTDPEFCEATCDAVEDRFSLPQAFCEDWRYPDFDVTPAYCEPTEAMGCVDRCVDRLTRVPDVCHDALRAAADCAAHSGDYGASPASICFLLACHDVLFRVSIECHGLRDDLAAARARWAGEGSENYSYRYTHYSEQATVEVRSGVATVVAGMLPVAQTFPELFDFIEARFDEGAPAAMQYDPTLGYPADAVFYPPLCGMYPTDAWSISDVVLE